MSFDTATPYTASYLVFRQGGQIALLLREYTAWMNDHYALPAGKVEKKESFTQAAIREAKEEVGVDIKPSDLTHIFTGHRTHEDSDWVDAVFEVSQWQGELHNAEPEVHGELIWADPTHLPENMVPYVRFYIEQIATGKTYAEYGWI